MTTGESTKLAEYKVYYVFLNNLPIRTRAQIGPGVENKNPHMRYTTAATYNKNTAATANNSTLRTSLLEPVLTKIIPPPDPKAWLTTVLYCARTAVLQYTPMEQLVLK